MDNRKRDGSGKGVGQPGSSGGRNVNKGDCKDSGPGHGRGTGRGRGKSRE